MSRSLRMLREGADIFLYWLAWMTGQDDTEGTER